ncbi:MAG: TIGR04283 family arsenosugar biosynthesis glycosyltransferase [Sphingomicrobium sp.]
MLTIVIPALNASATLGPCLASLDGAEEIILVDGGSSDDSAEIARRAGANVMTATRGRGAQLRAGGESASGDWLLFLHADTRLGAGWRTAVAAHIDSAPDKAGYFNLVLDDLAWQARLIERGVALRVRLLSLPYGDQGLLISRDLYSQLGGFRPLALMEDVDLARRIGRHRLRLLDATALTSADRWRRDGWLRRTVRNFACLALYALGVSPARLARLYR